MIGKTRYYENLLLNAAFRGAALVFPSDWFVGLFTAAPTDTLPGTEPAGGAYDRFEVPADATNWLLATAGQTSNLLEILFPEATADWGEIVAVGIFDAGTGGNLWFAELLTVPQTVISGNQPRFVAGQLLVSEE